MAYLKTVMPVFAMLHRNRSGCREALSWIFLSMAGLPNSEKFPKYLLPFFQYGGRNLQVQLENSQKPASIVIYHLLYSTFEWNINIYHTFAQCWISYWIYFRYRFVNGIYRSFSLSLSFSQYFRYRYRYHYRFPSISVIVIVIVNKIDLFPLTGRFRYRFFCITFTRLSCIMFID